MKPQMNPVRLGRYHRIELTSMKVSNGVNTDELKLTSSKINLETIWL
jgi:hypothetical protein